MTTIDQLYYFSKSRDAVPGKGCNESVTDAALYEELSHIAHWRRILSNFHASEFTHATLRWNSIEHAYQSAKIKLADEKLAYQFSLDSGSLLSRSDGVHARKNRKLATLTDAQLHKWEAMQSDVMEEIMVAKFTQVAVANTVLRLTRDAELFHGAPRIAKQRMVELENARDKCCQDVD